MIQDKAQRGNMVTYDTAANNYDNGGVPNEYAEYENSFERSANDFFDGGTQFLGFRLPFLDDQHPIPSVAGTYKEPDGTLYLGFLGGVMPPVSYPGDDLNGIASGYPNSYPGPLTPASVAYFGNLPLDLQPGYDVQPPWVDPSALQ